MSHLHRFYIPADIAKDPEIPLPEDEAHHALRVVRVRVGDPVALFDGEGGEVIGSIARADRNSVVVRAEDVHTAPSPLAHVTLVQGWLKRDKHIEDIIRHGTELGVGRFVFFRADHSEKAPKLDPKWDRLAIETCKQCGRLWLPRFATASDLASALEDEHDTLLVATKDLEPLPLAGTLQGPRVSLAVGPEGDWTPDELERLRASGARPMSLGAATFRSEVAAVVASTLVLYELGLLGPTP